MSWLQFYKNKVNQNYLQYIGNKYFPFIDLLNKEIKHENKIAEFGCGVSNITKLLMMENPNKTYIAIDNCPNMLKLSELNLFKTMAIFRYIMPMKVKLILGDIREQFTGTLDVIHSHGVLEHLTPNEIRKTISNQLKICSKLYHYVPSNKYNYKSFGDELLLSKKQWKDLVNPIEIIEFNNGYDLILTWR